MYQTRAILCGCGSDFLPLPRIVARFCGSKIASEWRFSLRLKKRAKVAIVATSYRECRALRARNAKKVSKRSSRACRPGVPKKCRKSQKKCRESAEERPFRHFFDFFGTFLALRADRPETTFLGLFWHFGPGGPGTPCNWSLQSKGKSDSFLLRASLRYPSLQRKSLANADARFWCTQRQSLFRTFSVLFLASEPIFGQAIRRSSEEGGGIQ